MKPLTPIEQWFWQMDAALSQRQILHVQAMSDGSVIAITKYAGMSSFLAGREIIDQIKRILSHMRAARDAPISEETEGFREIQALLVETRELVAELREHNRLLKDCPTAVYVDGFLPRPR